MLAGHGRTELYEWTHASTIGKVVFDIDARSTDTTPAELLEAALAAIDAFFGFRPMHIVIAASHGDALPPDHPCHTKLSYRIFVLGFRMTMADQKARILRLGLDSRHGGPFDPAIYSVNQKLRMVGSIKTPDDPRVLARTDGDPTAARLRDTLVQVVDPDWPLLTEDAPQHSAPKRAPPSASAPELAPAPAPASVPPATKRGRTTKENTLPQEWRAMLDSLGFSATHSLSAFQDTRGAGYSFTADNRRDCPCCAQQHDSNNWFVVRKPDGTFLVKSHSDRCRFRTIRPNEPAALQLSAQGDTLQDKLQRMDLDTPPTLGGAEGELHYHTFACRRSECLACAADHGGACEYSLQEIIKGAAWKLSNNAPTCRGTLFHSTSLLASYLDGIIREPTCTSLTQTFLAANASSLWCEQTLQDIRMWTGQTWKRVTPKEFGNLAGDWLVFLIGQSRQMDAFSDSAKQLKEALGMCKAPHQQQALAQKILSTHSLACRGQAFDADPWLLGCEDCVVDLRTGVIRVPTRADRVSVSTGFDFLAADRDTRPIHALMEKIYPVEDERRFMQAFAGYCLTGSCAEKLMLCCTDRRGGSNGKTTFKKILRQALGDNRYAAEGNKEIIYVQSHSRDANAHDAGKLVYEFKRCVVFDEMSSKRALDNGVVKEFTSGDAHPLVRPAFGAAPRSMTWTAKFVLIWNEGEAPKLRAEDDALMARLVVVHHRAKFCKDERTFVDLTERGEQYVHMVDKEAEAQITPPRALAWALEGLDIYRREGFTKLPEVFHQWRHELMMEFDDVAAWAATFIGHETGRHFLLQEAFDQFALTGVKLTKLRFSARLQKLFPGSFHTHKKVNGARMSGVFGNLVLKV